jgi:hypothetical protein
MNEDTLKVGQRALPKSYSKQVIINGFLSAGLGITAGICHIKGNDAYTDYQNSTTAAQAIDNWDKTKLYDNMRNICTAGAVFFAARTLYYHIKNRKIKKAEGPKPSPLLDFKYIDTSKWVLCIQKAF